MAAKHSFVSTALLNVLETQMLPVNVRKEVMATMHAQANRLFGPNPDGPEMILVNREDNAQDYVSVLFELFARHSTNHWALTAHSRGPSAVRPVL